MLSGFAVSPVCPAGKVGFELPAVKHIVALFLVPPECGRLLAGGLQSYIGL